MEKGFFKVFNPETSAKRMKIPTGYTNYKNGKLPRKVSQRDRYGNMWPIRVTKQERDIYFKYGWEKFIKDNNMEFADFLIFDYDGKGTFDFKLLGINGCVKNGAGGKKKGGRNEFGCQKANACKVSDVPKHYGADIFKSGCATQPKNPYFLAKIRERMRDQLYIPMDVLRDYKLELPSSMTIRDSAGREFETRVTKWTDGRIWLLGRWRKLARFNLVEKDDMYICEFVRAKCGKGLYLQVQVLHEGSSSHLDNK
ncbi:hypothetical protein R3W88_033766 [Solanum pinnatisectum]|uniref:TF-B3 domain-containing protein n=1 Tax=Solanum pinnatisectum TaxID=50273 RepID=A0AAV9K012_9SOLN|nr:hypothetical protein R3W88_033766 [Solanum pinnatisectum]